MSTWRASMLVAATLSIAAGTAATARAGRAVRVKDILASPAVAPNVTSRATVVGTTGYMTGWTEQTGTELWKTDATQARTVLLKDVCPGSCDSLPSELVNVNGVLYFAADNGRQGRELWKSDGTAAGTLLVKDISPGPTGSDPSGLVNVNGTLYFAADDGSRGRELWRSNGTEAGTVLVADIAAGGSGSGPNQLVSLNGVVLFSAQGAGGVEPWRSDGTSVGTYRLADINPGGSSNPGPFAVVTAVAVPFSCFPADDGTTGVELWKTDGTPSGTVLVKDIAPAGSSSPEELTVVNGTVMFNADDGTSGRELWKSGGTATSTEMVADIAGVGGSDPSELTNVNGMLYFSANDTTSGAELWKSDSTGPGTVLVKDLSSGPASSRPLELTAVGGTLYFSASSGPFARSLFKSGGSAASTMAVTDTAGSGPQDPESLAIVNGILVLASVWTDSGGEHREYWRTDGTAAGTSTLTQTTRLGSDPRDAIDLGGRVYFTAQSLGGGAPRSVWRTDGTAPGTSLVADPGTVFCDSPYQLTGYYNSLDDYPEFDFISRECGSLAWTLFVNGSARTTAPVQVDPGVKPLPWGPFALYFVASDGTSGNELWVAEGFNHTSVRMIKDIAPGASSSAPAELIAVGSKRFFSADDGVHGRELWITDGSDAGTVMVKDIASSPTGASSSPRSLTRVSAYEGDPNGLLFFVATTGTGGAELWKSDGTVAGTVMVKDIWPGAMSSNPGNLTPVNGGLYFTAQSGTQAGYELWKSDGTAAGTLQVADIDPGPASSYPSQLTPAGSRLFFTADDGVHGTELWKSDGTAAGTRMVFDLVPGPDSGPYVALAAAPGLANSVLFMADDRVHGVEPWYSDGTAAGELGEGADEGRLFGTQLIQDVNPGLASGGIGMGFIVSVRSMVMFGATDGVTGLELWRLLPEVTITDAVASVGPAGTSVALVVKLSPPRVLSAPIPTVDFQTVDGTALAVRDYTARSGTLSLGEVSTLVTIQLAGKSAPGDTLSFAVRLSSPVNAYIGDGEGQVTVVNANGAPSPLARPQPVWQPFFAVDTRETPYAGDFNGDGRTDVITFTRNNPLAVGDVYVSLSNGAAFGPSLKWNDWFAISQDETVVIGDYNGDGRDDIATWLGKSTRQVYVALSTGSGMTPAVVWRDAIGSDAGDVLLSGDANADGKADLVLFARSQGKVYVALSGGTKFNTPTMWHAFFAVSTYERPRVADLDGDGRADILTFASDSPTAFGDVYVALSTGTRFGDGANSGKWHDWFAIDPNEEIAIGDVNGDGRDDVLTFLPPSRGGEYYVAASLAASMGPSVRGADKVRLSPTDRVAVGDVNGDHMADVIVFAQGEGKALVTLTH